jgi:RHS repeat-associated protein
LLLQAAPAAARRQPLRFAARELDATAGLYYVRARWYDASMGRFISEDPIGLAGGINNYAYAANDPVNLSDPSGLGPCDLEWGGWGTTRNTCFGEKACIPD